MVVFQSPTRLLELPLALGPKGGPGVGDQGLDVKPKRELLRLAEM